MLKKLYLRPSENRTYAFDIIRTVRVDEPDFTEWIVSVDGHNELGFREVAATTDDWTFDIIDDEVLVAVKIRQDEWIVHVVPDHAEPWTVKGTISWTERGSLKITDRQGGTTHLSELLREFDVYEENRVITVRDKN